jgi:hypothetical protein
MGRAAWLPQNGHCGQPDMTQLHHNSMPAALFALLPTDGDAPAPEEVVCEDRSLRRR